MYFCSSFTLTIRNGFDINCIRLWTFFCKFYMLLIKFNYAAPFSLLKLLQIWFHPSASLFNTFVRFLCLRFLTFLTLVRDTLLIRWNVKRGFCFTMSFTAVYVNWWCFVVFWLSPSSLSWLKPLCTFESASGWLFFLPLSLLKYFLSQILVTQWLTIFSKSRWKYRIKKRQLGVPAPLCTPKSKAFLYL